MAWMLNIYQRSYVYIYGLALWRFDQMIDLINHAFAVRSTTLSDFYKAPYVHVYTYLYVRVLALAIHAAKGVHL